MHGGSFEEIRDAADETLKRRKGERETKVCGIHLPAANIHRQNQGLGLVDNPHELVSLSSFTPSNESDSVFNPPPLMQASAFKPPKEPSVDQQAVGSEQTSVLQGVIVSLDDLPQSVKREKHMEVHEAIIVNAQRQTL